MIILIGFSIGTTLLSVLCASLALLLLVIAYKKLLTYFGKTAIPPANYCVLYGLETHPSKGELEFYFTTNETRKICLELLNDDLSLNSIIEEKEVKEGGNIIRFDSKLIPNGTYFYQLRTENQKTMKRFTIEN